MADVKLIFEYSVKGRRAFEKLKPEVPAIPADELLPDKYLRREPAELPEISEVDAVRHYTGLSKRNHGVDSGFYPLGSCTMKYNPKINEDVANLSGLSKVHPLQPDYSVQGCLELMYKMQRMLSEITGMHEFTLQPAAGAHGELTGLMIMKEYQKHIGQTNRKKMIVPDSAHGTNPASAAMLGYEIVEVKSDSRGNVDVEALKGLLDENVAGLMLTNPNTLGLFDENILEISKLVHDAGGLLYYDGANMNAIMGICRPGDMGFDIVHLNLHKTFSTPHGGGGPGSGPVGVKKELEEFLPGPLAAYSEQSSGNCCCEGLYASPGEYYLKKNMPLSIGAVKAFYGNFGVIVKAFAYILTMGAEGLKEASETAVLNANYLMNRLKRSFSLPFDRVCMHEFVLSGERQKENGVSTLDMAKRLLDFGFHPPTTYFPLIVKEAIMIEPTETESRETLDVFAEVMEQIAHEVANEPEKVTGAPTTVVSRLDETRAARKPVLRWRA